MMISSVHATLSLFRQSNNSLRSLKFCLPFSSSAASLSANNLSRKKSRQQPVLSALEYGGVKITRQDVVKDDDPTNNVPDNIFSKLGMQLHRRDQHPLGIIKNAIYDYFDTNYSNKFNKFDDLSPIVSLKQNFDDVLVPEDHVSRSYNDTYYIDPQTVLRCHTSAHQAELLRDGQTHFLVTGDVYRRDSIDSTHYPVFHQMEGFRVFVPDEWEASGMDGTSFAAEDLKKCLGGLAHHLFGDVEMRWVDTYFPFTNPSFELEIYFKEKWLEVLGCGVTEQEILKRNGKSNNVAWAFGLGLERLAMVLFDIPDIRLFWSDDERFTSQFSKGQLGVKFKFEIPSNFMLIKTNPTLWIPFIMVSWGLVMTLMAFVKDFAGLMTARFFLGAFESGLFPGAIYYITTWYKRSETNYRIAIFAIGTAIAGSFSGLLAYGIVRLDGWLHLKGWQWLFLIEGLITVLISALAYFLLSDYPEKTKWLSDEERKYAVGRLKNDAGKAHTTHFDKKHIYAALTDWKVYLAMLHLAVSSITFYSFALFMPTIINGMGFDFVKSQLLSVPPYLCAGVTTLVLATISDRKDIRSPFIISCSIVAIIGYILLVVPSVGIPGKYAGACIVGSGLFPTIVTSITWLTNNIAGHAKRAIATAMVMMCANLGGALASQVYRQKDYPHYTYGHSISLGFLITATFISIAQLLIFKTLNKKKKENPQSFLEGKTEEEIKNLGDLHPDFIYKL